ncbi:MAG: long-chain fatty acid--CoA ligase [Deltaproteobacteria bacterium]|nr:MAG: long-chain fatty acid--CoA ligase [Deltaproteobacteria bacterium]
MSGWIPVGNIIKVLAHQDPEKEAVADLSRTLTFREWNERCNRFANALLDLGLKKGDRVAFIAHNSLEWMEFYGATAKAGLIAVPIMFRLAPKEYQYILENSETAAFLVADDFIEGAESIRKQLPGVSNWIHVGGGATPDGYMAYEALMEKGSSEEPPVEVNPDDVWTITYTSGTTGRPKGAVRTHEAYVAFFLTNFITMGFSRGDRGLFVMPMCHVNSIYYGFTLLYCGASSLVYSVASFDPTHFLKTLQDFKVSFTSLVPTHYIMILDLPEEVKNSFDVSTVEKLLCSSAPVRKETKMEILEFFEKSKLYEAYGSTEAGKVTVLPPEMQLIKPGSIGREIPGTELIKILDEERNELPVGEPGELFSRTPSCFKEYWKLPEETKAAFHGEWFSAGDIAYKDEDGYYYLVDRKKNMIITGGENVYPTEVEKAVGEHPCVKDVAVVGLPDDKWGERVSAFIILRGGYEPSEELSKEIQTFLKDKIAGFKRPKEVIFISDEEMPRTATGKILHRELRNRYGQ